jgi:peptide/nickel transport system substrate-binding protein
MVSDFVAGSYLTYAKNPDYYGYDPRHPANKLPYLDKLEILCIPDDATAVAAIRTGQLDMLNDMDWQTAENLKKSNPELVMDTRPDNGPGLQPRCDQEPFTDIRVRKAMQLAVNITEIAQKFYGGNVPAEPVGLISPGFKGWYTPFENWPQSLKDEYKYDPAQAKALMAEAGYPDGFKTKLHMSSTGNSEFAQIMKSYLKEIGIDADINVIEDTAWTPFIVSADYTGIALASWLGMVWPVGISFFDATTMNFNNAMRQPDKTYDQYYEQFMNSKTTEEAQKILITADQYAMKQHWQVATTVGVYYNIWQPYVMGYSGEIMSGLGWDRHMTWMKFWVDQNKKKEMGR